MGLKPPDLQCDLCEISDNATSLQVSGLDNAVFGVRATELGGTSFGMSLSGGPSQVQGNPTPGYVTALMTTSNAYKVAALRSPDDSRRLA